MEQILKNLKWTRTKGIFDLIFFSELVHLRSICIVQWNKK